MKRLIAGLVAVIGAGMLACAGTPASAQTTEIDVATYKATAESLKSDGRTWEDATKLREGATVTLPDGTEKMLPEDGTVWAVNEEYVIAQMTPPEPETKTVYVKEQCRHPTSKRFVSCSSIVEEQAETITSLQNDLGIEELQNLMNLLLVIAACILATGAVAFLVAPVDGLSHTYGAAMWHDFKTWNATRKRRAQSKKERKLTPASPQGS